MYLNFDVHKAELFYRYKHSFRFLEKLPLLLLYGLEQNSFAYGLLTRNNGDMQRYIYIYIMYLTISYRKNFKSAAIRKKKDTAT